MTIAPRNPSLLERLELFVVAMPRSRRHFEAKPLGIDVAEWYHPLRSASVPMLELLQRLDALTFGAEGMPMPRWMYLDGVELTGAIVGLGERAAAVPAERKALLNVPADYRGLVPYAVYMALPTFEPGCWFGHNLASITAYSADPSLAGLGSLTKALALALYRTRVQVGATQWGSVAMFVHTRLGPLELVTADTPAHGGAATLTYRVAITEQALKNLARDPSATLRYPEPDQWIASDDHTAIAELQRRIEAGERLYITGRPKRTDGSLSVPIA